MKNKNWQYEKLKQEYKIYVETQDGKKKITSRREENSLYQMMITKLDDLKRCNYY